MVKVLVPGDFGGGAGQFTGSRCLSGKIITVRSGLVEVKFMSTSATKNSDFNVGVMINFFFRQDILNITFSKSLIKGEWLSRPKHIT